MEAVIHWSCSPSIAGEHIRIDAPQAGNACGLLFQLRDDENCKSGFFGTTIGEGLERSLGPFEQ